MSLTKLFLPPAKRINRKDFWLVMSILGVLSIGFALLSLIWLVWAWPCSILVLSLASKRAHDIGKPAKFATVPISFAIVAVAIGVISGTVMLINIMGPVENSASIVAVSTIIGVVSGGSGLTFGILFLTWLGCCKGDASDNEYGPAPKSFYGL